MARDGHTGLIFKDTFIVFGGDRHHMPFNDVFMLDLKADFAQRRLSKQFWYIILSFINFTLLTSFIF